MDPTYIPMSEIIQPALSIGLAYSERAGALAALGIASKRAVAMLGVALLITVQAGDSFTDNCGCAGNQAADYTYRNDCFMGGVQAAGGMCQVVGGMSLAGAGIFPSSTGIGASIGYGSFCSGIALSSYGIDNFNTGLNQFWTGSTQDSATSQLLESTGSSKETAVLAEMGLAIMLGQGVNGGTKAGSSISLQTNAAKNTVLEMGFTPQIVEGNKSFGSRHTLKRHAFGSNAKRPLNFYLKWKERKLSNLFMRAPRRLLSGKLNQMVYSKVQ